jgi:uracil-DNA glycosylase
MATTLVGTWLEGVDPSWLPVLAPVSEALERAAREVISAESAGVQVFPAREQVLRALRVPLGSVRVLIVGQDPYPTASHAVGLSFSVSAETTPLPGSLRNIFRELVDDLGCASPATGDLSLWSHQGVMLLNRVLTVREGEAGSMRRCGWEEVTLAIVTALAAQPTPPVAILWGADAHALADTFPVDSRILSTHPSPLSAYRGFFGSRPFSRANELLVARGGTGVNWELPA